MLVYDLPHRDHTKYLSSYAQFVRAPRINTHYDHLLNNKLFFHHLMESVRLNHPQLLGFSDSGRLVASNGAYLEHPEEWLRDCLETFQALVIKPVKGRGGRGLLILKQTRTAGRIEVNGKQSSLGEVKRRLGSSTRCIVTEFVTQAAYAKRVYPATSNTVRLLTIWDYEKYRPFVLAAAHRFGSSRSFPTDNFKSGFGGLSSEIDLDSGTLGPAATVTGDPRLAWVNEHPETGEAIAGITVPGWYKLKTEVCRAAQELFFAPQIAWDVLITDAGFSVLEVNGSPAIHAHQVHKPVLADPRARKFYRTHGVVRQAAGIEIT
jgi:hypothetical protein